MPRFVTYATPGYLGEAQQLLSSAKSWGIEVELYEIEDLGSWDLNTHYKARFIIDRLLEDANAPLVWLDADARVCARPDLLYDMHEDVDFAATWRTDLFGQRYGPVGEMLSGTMYFRGPTALHLCEQWAKRLASTPVTVWEQFVLQQVVDEAIDLGWLHVYRLPPEYTCIIGGKAAMGTMATAVIAHTQASRRLRNAR